MSRYSILLGKSETKPPEPAIRTIGFDDIGSIAKYKSPSIAPFRLHERECYLVGISYPNKQQLFVTAKIHYYAPGRCMIRCKSGAAKEICCTHNYEGNRPYPRYACILAVHSTAEGIFPGAPKFEGIQLVPWIFPRTMYQRLNEIHRTFSLFERDFYLRGTRRPFNLYDIEAAHQISLWRDIPNLASETQNLFRLLPRYLGRDMSLEEIRDMFERPTELIESPPLLYQDMAPRRIQEQRAAAVSINETGPEDDPEARDINLDELFKGIQL